MNLALLVGSAAVHVTLDIEASLAFQSFTGSYAGLFCQVSRSVFWKVVEKSFATT